MTEQEINNIAEKWLNWAYEGGGRGSDYKAAIVSAINEAVSIPDTKHAAFFKCIVS